jgi:hypothetical protein
MAESTQPVATPPVALTPEEAAKKRQEDQNQLRSRLDQENAQREAILRENTTDMFKNLKDYLKGELQCMSWLLVHPNTKKKKKREKFGPLL